MPRQFVKLKRQLIFFQCLWRCCKQGEYLDHILTERMTKNTPDLTSCLFNCAEDFFVHYFWKIFYPIPVQTKFFLVKETDKSVDLQYVCMYDETVVNLALCN